jgi:serine/threonine protein kinase
MATTLSPVTLTSFTGERFQLLTCIGRGTTGGVHRARSLGAGSSPPFTREVCIKRLSGQLAPEASRALLEEARILASVRHANVVSLLGMGHEPSGAPFLILELIEGADLRRLTKAIVQADGAEPSRPGILPDSVAVHVACSLLRALGAVQRTIPGLVHRDVTPHNVLISREGEVKLTDFGIALALDRARWTRPSVVKGKLGYMSPEQVRGDALDVRTDLFAVGVILFELLTRRRPWFAPYGTMHELRAIERGEIAPIAECRPRLDRVLADAVDRLLALDIGDRYSSCDAAIRALAPFAAGDMASLRLAPILAAAVPAPLALPSAPRIVPIEREREREREADTESAPKPDLALTRGDGGRVAYGQARGAVSDLSGIEESFHSLAEREDTSSD